MSQLKFFAPIVILVLLLLLRWVKSLDAFLLGESYAKGLGVSVRSIRIILIFFTAILTGVTTAFVGPIGFVGIVVPHVARMLFNSSKHTIIYPATILLGMLTMLLCDILSQLPDNGYVLPINAVTALVGAPIVLWILFGKGKMVI
jgi:iron complex transport system permease protein